MSPLLARSPAQGLGLIFHGDRLGCPWAEGQETHFLGGCPSWKFIMFTWETVTLGIFQEEKRKAVEGQQCSHQTLGNSQSQLSQESGCQERQIFRQNLCSVFPAD